MKHISAIAKTAMPDLWQPETADAVELAFLARQLVQITLPHTDPGDVPLWTRRNGNLTLVMTRSNVDSDGTTLIGYPYGTLPRLLLYWINSEAVRTKSPRLELGANLSRFMTEVGLNPRNGRGERSDARRLQNQMNRLFSASIRFVEIGELADGKMRRRDSAGPIVDSSELWWDPANPRQGYLWNSWIELREKFFKDITAVPVPLNMKALKALKRSPLALDLYAWMSYRSWNATRLNKPQALSWESLQAQLGSDYGDLDDFRTKVKRVMLKVIDLQPEFRISLSPSSIQIRPCQNIIEAKGTTV